MHVRPMKKRYHYNVADARLSKHVEKDNEDGLHISCVASATNLWALIMDAGTGFSSHVYELSPVFLPKDWIMEQWENNFFISSDVGAVNGSSLVVICPEEQLTLSNHTKLFLLEWINRFPCNWHDYCWKSLECGDVQGCRIFKSNTAAPLAMTSVPEFATAFMSSSAWPPVLLHSLVVEQNKKY